MVQRPRGRESPFVRAGAMITPSRSEREVWISREGPSRPDEDTPLGMRVGVLGRKWTLLILRGVTSAGHPSFTQLLRAHPRLSRRILSMRLKQLQREGYLERTFSGEKPQRTAYFLTAKGRDALPLLRAFSELVRRYGEGVPVTDGRSVRAEDLCFEHPDITGKRASSPDGIPVWSSPTLPTPPRMTSYKDRCGKCKLNLSAESEAYVCSYECTWCRSCAERFGWQCPNCQGRLQLRPRLHSK